MNQNHRWPEHMRGETMRIKLKANKGRRIIIIVNGDEVQLIRKKFGDTCGGDSPDKILIFKKDEEDRSH